jgi:hypothetical protein
VRRSQINPRSMSILTTCPYLSSRIRTISVMCSSSLEKRLQMVTCLLGTGSGGVVFAGFVKTFLVIRNPSLSWSSGITGEARKIGEGPAQLRAGRHRKPIKTKPALDADLGGLQKVLTCVSLDCEMGQTIPSSAIKFNVEKAWRQGNP